MLRWNPSIFLWLRSLFPHIWFVTAAWGLRPLTASTPLSSPLFSLPPPSLFSSFPCLCPCPSTTFKINTPARAIIFSGPLTIRPCHLCASNPISGFPSFLSISIPSRCPTSSFPNSPHRPPPRKHPLPLAHHSMWDRWPADALLASSSPLVKHPNSNFSLYHHIAHPFPTLLFSPLYWHCNLLITLNILLIYWVNFVPLRMSVWKRRHFCHTSLPVE